MKPVVVVTPDPAGLAAERMAETAAKGGHVVLSGGSTPRAAYERAADMDVGWSAATLWFGDERFVVPDSPDRNAVQAREAFLDAVGAIEVHDMPSTADATDVATGAAAYGATMRRYGAGQFDVLMLGVGPDGHVAWRADSAPSDPLALIDSVRGA